MTKRQVFGVARYRSYLHRAKDYKLCLFPVVVVLDMMIHPQQSCVHYSLLRIARRIFEHLVRMNHCKYPNNHPNAMGNLARCIL